MAVTPVDPRVGRKKALAVGQVTVCVTGIHLSALADYRGMDRRAFLSTVGVTAATALGGCLAGGEREGLAVEGTALSVAPGDEATIVARAYDVTRFRFGGVSPRGIELVDTSVSPSPDGQADSFPPVWTWDAPESRVEGELRIAVSRDADTDEYAYEVLVENGETELRGEFSIAVSD
jgi:hypothetical protein